MINMNKYGNVRPEYIQRVESAIAALRAGEDRDVLLSEHGSVVVKAAEFEMAQEIAK